MNIINRENGIDILRLLSTAGVIVLHVFGTNFMAKNFSNTSPFIINYCSSLFLEILCMCSVNIFGIITGYLYIDRESYHSLSVIKLIYSVLLYSAIITLFIKYFHPEFIKNKQKFLEAIFPFGIRLWYITAYIFVFFMIPFLNIFVKNCPKQVFKVFICILTFFLSVLTTIGMKDYWGLLRGYSCLWLIYCYFLGAYIKINKIHFKKKYLLFCLIISICILLCFNMLSMLYKSKQFTKIYYAWRDYTSPLIIINGLCIFLLFKDLNIFNKGIKNILAICSKSALSVYIIHAQGLVLDNIIYPFMPRRMNYNPIMFIILGFAIILFIFLSCIIIDMIRLRFEKMCKIDKIEQKISIGLDKLLNY